VWCGRIDRCAGVGKSVGVGVGLCLYKVNMSEWMYTWECVSGVRCVRERVCIRVQGVCFILCFLSIIWLLPKS